MHTKLDIGNGRTAISFVPEDSKELAIVHLSTIRRLSANLKKVPLQFIKDNLKDAIDMSRNLEEVCSVMSEELAFHESINLIEKYEPEPVPNMMA